eukprot:1420221-Pleurochrysis_carterae.AAC.1
MAAAEAGVLQQSTPGKLASACRVGSRAYHQQRGRDSGPQHARGEAEPAHSAAAPCSSEAKGKSDEHRALGHREHATRPAASLVFVTGVCMPEPPGNEDKLARRTLAGAGRRKRVGCALEAGRAPVPLASAVGDGHEKAAAAGVGAGAAAVEAELTRAPTPRTPAGR